MQADPGLIFPAGLRKMCAFPIICCHKFRVSSLSLYLYLPSPDFVLAAMLNPPRVLASSDRRDAELNKQHYRDTVLKRRALLGGGV